MKASVAVATACVLLAGCQPASDWGTDEAPRPGVAPIEKAFREAYFSDRKPKQALRFERMAPRRLGPDVALVTGRYILSGGTEPDQTGWFTTIWTRTARGWKVVHDHSS